MRVLRKGASLIEIAVVIFVISYGLTSVYLILSRGWKLAETTSNRIAAINLAREGIEAITNARDTNWIKFAANYPSCWKVQNYDQRCVGANTPSTYGFGGGGTASLVPFLSGSMWHFTDATNSGVYVDTLGLPYQTGTLATAVPSNLSKICQLIDPNATNCRSNMRRVIVLTHPDSTSAGVPPYCGAGTGCLSVTSRVDWYDSATQSLHTVQLDTLLTNWRNNF